MPAAPHSHSITSQIHKRRKMHEFSTVKIRRYPTNARENTVPLKIKKKSGLSKIRDDCIFRHLLGQGCQKRGFGAAKSESQIMLSSLG